MANEPSDNIRHADELGGLQRWVTSALLIIFTMFVAAICILLLSSTLTQSRLTNLNIDGVELTIRKLANIAEQWVESNVQKKNLLRRLNNAESKREVLTPRKTEADAYHLAASKEMEGVLVEFYFRCNELEPELAKQIHKQGYDDQVGRIRAAKEKLIAKHPQLAPAVEAIETAYGRFRDARQKRGDANAALAGPEQEIKQISAAIKASDLKQQSAYNLIKPNLDEAGRARVENAFFELNVKNYENSIDPAVWLPRRMFALLSHKLLTQPDLLTFFLVIFMGVLGSALHITHSFFMKNQAQTLGLYFQRISVGAMTALVIFIVAKAGVPVIAEPGRLGGEATINPYFVSFLAIISGLLSENAIANIQAQGARFLGAGGAGPDRWAHTDLTTGLETDKLSVAAIARQLGIDAKVAEAKLKGEAEIKPDEQKSIALMLRRDMRDIFTDIPPPKK